jgi:hypothetical protein
MADDDLTKSVTVKRSAKKKSGYTVGRQDDFYYVAEAPAKARVKPGDRVVGINGITSDEFIDEDDANDLIESIRIVVVPKDKLEEYDELHGEDDDDEEEFEEYDRSKKRGGPGAVPIPAGGGRPKVCKKFKLSFCLFLVVIQDNSDVLVDLCCCG